MADRLDQTFLEQINAHAGIAHKVGRMYFQDPEERADVLQEMWYQLWKSYPGFGGRSSFTTWMYRVCLNTALAGAKNQPEPAGKAFPQSTGRLPSLLPIPGKNICRRFLRPLPPCRR